MNVTGGQDPDPLRAPSQVLDGYLPVDMAG